MKSKSVFVCTECEYRSVKWLGRCPSCNAWNSFEEVPVEEPDKKGKTVPSRANYSGTAASVSLLSDTDLPDYIRTPVGCGELDRVLGGGLVDGSVVLLSGEPGIGKSTLLMQISAKLAKEKTILYVSGEESQGQLKLRAKRLGVSGENIWILTETNMERILQEADKLTPDILIVDSVQTVYTDLSSTSPGSVTQVRECTLSLIGLAKNKGISVILVGHVNKEGGIAGPKVLEHMVDAVLCFEGEQQHSYRIIRAAKNRFGSVSEIGVFEMTGEGLAEVPNPSEALLEGRPKGVSGNCAVCIMEGSRPIIAEIQALVSPSPSPSPRRAASGLEYNRLYLLLAVLEKRLGLKFSSCDAYLNVVGGLRLDEPASDLPSALALISSIKDIPLPDDMIAVGELGLSGEVRAVPNMEQRMREASRLGFTKMLVPARGADKKNLPDEGIELIPVRSIFDALAAVLKRPEGTK